MSSMSCIIILNTGHKSNMIPSYNFYAMNSTCYQHRIHMNAIVYLGSILILLIIGVINVNGQPNNVKAPTFPSPNAASLGKYGDIPVSYHTGVPNISIPIYTVTQGSLSLPISLSYHSSGLKVDEVASNVGLGWSLNAGGMITRSVNGGPDEGVSSGVIDGMSPLVGWGWYKNGGIPADVISCSPRPLSIEGPVMEHFQLGTAAGQFILMQQRDTLTPNRIYSHSM